MLNNLNAKINHGRKPMPRPQPGMPPMCHPPKPAPGRQDDAISGPGGRPKPRLPQPGDTYVGGPGPKGQQQYDAKHLAQAAGRISEAPEYELRPGGPFKLDEGFSLLKLLNK